MSSQPHLELFQASHDEPSSFKLFPRLPQEIRLKIWKHSLQRQRIIKVLLTTQATQEAAEDPNQASPYDISVNGHQISSKLLSTNSESRSTALSFYRVHIPCNMKGHAPTPKPGILYLNPEHDFLQITPNRPVHNSPTAFLHDLKTIYDPRHIGLLNLALELNDLTAMRPSESTLSPKLKTSFTQTLSQLHEVWFIESARAGRQVLGPVLSGLPTSEYFFNRSMPIMARTTSFERLSRDPRPIKDDLRRVFVGTFDPRGLVLIWRELLAKWNIRSPQTQYKFQLSYDPTLEREIYDREGAREFLRKEDDVWTGKIKGCLSEYFPAGAQVVQEDLDKVARPAVGFWLFPIEGLGPLEEAGQPKRIVDMREYWPELCLLDLN